MANPGLCTHQEIVTLVHSFYTRVRADDELGPIFERHISDWDTHLARMVQFWSSLLLGSGTYQGSPMPAHIALPELSADLFKQWLALFEQTTAQFENRQFAQQALEFAHRIARSLWYGHQLSRNPDRSPSEIFAS